MGHTHNQLDGTFGVLSRNIYGRQCGGTTARDILSFSGFAKICKEILGDRLVDIVDIRAVYDFKGLLAGCRPQKADKFIQEQFAVTFTAKEDGRIMCRSKRAVSATVPWSADYLMMPHPECSLSFLPPRTEQPLVMPEREWPEFAEKVVPSLLRFYKYEFKHPVSIPEDERIEMIRFLKEGPPLPRTPEWIPWDDMAPTTTVPPPTTTVTDTRPRAGAKRRRDWRPFLQPRPSRTRKRARPVAAASTTDERAQPAAAASTHTGAPAVPNDSDTDNEVPGEFPYRLGTFVAVEFTDGIYSGCITKLFPGEDSCLVTFSDGDKAEYDADQIQYAIELYEQEFENDNSDNSKENSRTA